MNQPDASLAAPSSPVPEAAPGTQPPVCAECSHLLGRRDYTDMWEVWKCSKLPTGRNLISGVQQFETCKYSRSSVSPQQCGTEGRLFERYTPPEHRPSAGGKASADALLEQLENLK